MTKNDQQFFKRFFVIVILSVVYAILSHYQSIMPLWVAKGFKMTILAVMGWNLALMCYNAIDQLKQTIQAVKRWLHK